ncbi:uncharacterized protein LOC117785526 [Drosophila innubila]|uniref:uncharacterized protein LOC117785526 n=1 Tax=Drosophila innubila TaxID=198719 RepID=UPI00148D07E2|nr:uncharacterized protein LOC117785526 [Drosophila innubila]
MMNKMFFMRLNTAGVVIGWLGLLGSFVLTCVLSAILGYSDVIAKSFVEKMEVTDPNAYEEIHMFLVVVCSVYLAINVLNLLASGMLVLGTMKERHLMLLPWLINAGLSMLVNILYVMGGFIGLFASPMPEPYINIVLYTAVVLAIQIYIFYGIYSLFKQIQQNSDQQRPLIQPQAEAVPHQTTTYPNYTKI